MIGGTVHKMKNPLIGTRRPIRYGPFGAPVSRKLPGSFIVISRSLFLALFLLSFLIPPSVRAQSGGASQFLFAVEGGPNPAIVTYSVDQATGALTTRSGVAPVPMRALPYPVPSAVNPAGTFLFVPSQNSSSQSALSVFSISSTGALTELAASPFSASRSTVPLSLAVSLDGQYLYAASAPSNSSPSNAILDVYSIGADGTLTPVQNYLLPQLARFLYLHPTGLWLYVYGAGDTTTSSIERFTVGPSGTLTDDGAYALPQYSASPRAIVGGNDGKYLFALHGQFSGPATMIDTLSVNGNGGVLSLASTYSTTDPGSIQPEYEAVDPTGGFLYSTFANFSVSNGALTLIQSNSTNFGAYDAPMLLTSRTSPFLFAAAQTQAGYFLSSNLIGGDGSLTPAPGSPYTIPIGILSLAVTGSLPAPAEPVFTLSRNSITFASISPAQTTASAVTLSSTGFSPLLINSISVSGDASFSQTNDCPTSLAAGSSCTVTLQWAPTSAGTFTGALNIDSNAPAATVSLTGTTAPAVPQIFISPANLTFPSTVIGVPSASRTFTATNLAIATAPLHVSGVAIGGSNPGDFSQTNDCTAAIPAGGSCSIVVTFTPLAAGGRSATVLVTNDTLGNSPATSIVAGVGSSAPTQYQLQTSAVGPGTIQQSPSGATFDANTSITLTAVPDANATFTSWAGACAGSSLAVCNFSLAANTTVTATFTANPALSVPQGQQSGAAGSTFTFPVTVTGFTTQPTLTASCSIPNGSCSINGTKLVVTTAASSSSIFPLDFPRGPLALLLVLAILALLANPRRRRVLRPALLVGGLILLAGCGSSGGGGANTNTGTPAGTYTVTIHATSGAQTATTTVSVVVH